MIIILLLILTANGVSPGGSGTAMRHITQEWLSSVSRYNSFGRAANRKIGSKKTQRLISPPRNADFVNTFPKLWSGTCRRSIAQHVGHALFGEDSNYIQNSCNIM
jgi:hypothetical protein